MLLGLLAVILSKILFKGLRRRFRAASLASYVFLQDEVNDSEKISDGTKTVAHWKELELIDTSSESHDTFLVPEPSPHLHTQKTLSVYQKLACKRCLG